MENSHALELIKTQMAAAAQELRDCNAYTAAYGLSLSDKQITGLVQHRFEALRSTGRIEFGSGILKKLILAFCDSPHISQGEYEETLLELQDAFYYYINECMDRYSDDELIDYMKMVFNGRAHGELDFLIGTSLEDLCRYARGGYDPQDADDELF
jgi:hypothetical protein